MEDCPVCADGKMVTTYIAVNGRPERFICVNKSHGFPGLIFDRLPEPERCPGSDVMAWEASFSRGGELCEPCGQKVPLYWDGVQFRKAAHNRPTVRAT